MAIQAHMYPNNLGVPLQSQDWLLMSNNNTIIPNNIESSFNNSNNMFNGCGINETNLQNLQQKLQQQQQQQQLQKQVQFQQQQQYLIHLQNMQQRNSPVNNSYVLMPLSKRQNLGKPTTTNTATTTASTTTSESENMSMNISRSLSAQLEKQGQEIERFVTLQCERLRLALREQRKQQLGVIVRKLEEKAMRLIKQKDDEIVEATKRTFELQEIMRKMEVENQFWQKVASDNEQMVLNLSNTLEQIQQQQQEAANSACSSNCVDDAESCCIVSDNNKRRRDDGVAETGGNRGETATGGRLCKVCKSRDACILLLPCRHMCCCKSCEAFLDACPVCTSAKMASIEALIS